MKTLRFITCGSVDDGKSTLIGRMLYESKMIYADQEKSLILDSSLTNQDGELDYALLLDGLMAEREQGITIDVAYRYFTTKHRSFIVADTPGHEEYTRNMAVGASFSDLAILLIDITKGLSIQTKRHLRICQLMGVKKYVFAVNKMDLVDYNEAVYNKLVLDLEILLGQFSTHLDYISIPLSAKQGDNLIEKSNKMPWYKGEALLPHLEKVEIKDNISQDFILPIQRVSRPHMNFRGFQGQVVSGSLKIGDSISVFPGNMTAKVESLYQTDKQVEVVEANDAVTLTLDREIDISRGDVLTNSELVKVSNGFVVNLLWTGDEALTAGGHYYMKLGTKLISAIVTKIVHQIDIHSGEEKPIISVEKNDLVECHITTFEEIAYAAFTDVADLGRFILIDKLSNMTAACGIIKNNLSSERNLTYHQTAVTRQIRANQKQQSPKTIWFTGLSGAGKSTLANALESYLTQYGKHTMLLDGDNIRFGINKNLGFSSADRLENIRRVAEVAKILNDAGVIAITSTISPTIEHRQLARNIIGDKDFIEVYVSTGLETCEKRDIKGLYKKAHQGLIKNMTGVQEPYEISKQANVVIDTTDKTIEESLEELVKSLSNFID